MRTVVYLAALLVAMGGAGCFGGKRKGPPPAAVVEVSHPAATNAAPSADTFTVAPDDSLSGRVSFVNTSLHFVVLTFPLGQMPVVDSHMNIFRNGAIVGEIKITGPQRDDNTVADIVLGDAQKGDEVREK